MKNKTNKQEPHKIRRMLTYVLIGFIGLLIIGAIYERIAEYVDTKKIKVPGSFIEVNGKKMHYYCMGENNGKPTVILESGAGGNYNDWYKVQPEIAKHTKVCSYDRAGLGFSEKADNKHTSSDVANELKMMLENAKIPGPYVLVGHSLGGIYVRVFADNNRDKVSGLVLVDPTVEEMGSIKPTFFQNTVGWGMGNLIMLSSQTGVMRLVMTFFPNIYVYPTDTPLLIAGVVTPTQNLIGFTEANKIEYSTVSRAINFNNIPVVVLSADKSLEQVASAIGNEAKNWDTNLTKRLSINSRHILVKDSNHYIQIDQPQSVTDTIVGLLKP